MIYALAIFIGLAVFLLVCGVLVSALMVEFPDDDADANNQRLPER